MPIEESRPAPPAMVMKERVDFARHLFTSVVSDAHAQLRREGRARVWLANPPVDKATWAAIPEPMRTGVLARIQAVIKTAETGDFGQARVVAEEGWTALAAGLPDEWSPPDRESPEALAAKIPRW